MALPELIDSHAHLDADVFDQDRDECVRRANVAGVTRILTVGAGYGAESARRAIALAERHDCVWASIGVHPHDAKLGVEVEELRALAQHPKVVAIGETGLDFCKELSPRADQFEAFERQVVLALEVRKPLIIHSRDAGNDCLALLQRMGAAAVGGVFHCYAEDAAFAGKLREINFRVSFPGTLTFKKAEIVRAVCKDIPLDQILVETDSPYMAPEPHRGKRCEPAFVALTAAHLAQVKGLPLEDVAAITTANTLKLFSNMR